MRLGRRRHWFDLKRLILVASTVLTAALGSCASPTAPLTSTGTAQGALAPLTVSGNSVLTTIGQTSQLSVADATGAAVTSGLTWSSAAQTVATVSTSGLVTAVGLGSAGIQVRTPSALGVLTVFVVQPSTTAKTITACGGIQTPGSYVLGNDLSLPPGLVGTCFVVSNTASVQVDCRGHVVPYLVISAATSVTAANCMVTNQVLLLNASAVSLTNLTVGGGVVATSSASVSITNSTIAGQPQGLAAVQMLGGGQLLLQNNTINAAGAAYAVYITNGTGNRVLGNTVSGIYSGGSATVGTDDGILLIGEMNDTVQGNTITNFFDAGVEGVDFVANTLVADNTVSNVGAAGVGSYWCTKWTNNVIRGNSVTTAPAFLFVNYSKGVGQCGPTALAGSFVGNQIIGNTFRTPSAGTIGFLPTPRGSAPTAGPVARMIVDLFPLAFSTVPVMNNLVQGNDFGTTDGPFLMPLSGFTDGGGNLCGPTNPELSNFPCAGLGPSSSVKRRR